VSEHNDKKEKRKRSRERNTSGALLGTTQTFRFNKNGRRKKTEGRQKRYVSEMHMGENKNNEI